MDKVVCNKCRDEHHDKFPDVCLTRKVPFSSREEIPVLIRDGYVELGVETLTNIESGVTDKFFVMMFDERFYDPEQQKCVS